MSLNQPQEICCGFSLWFYTEGSWSHIYEGLFSESLYNTYLVRCSHTPFCSFSGWWGLTYPDIPWMLIFPHFCSLLQSLQHFSAKPGNSIDSPAQRSGGYQRAHCAFLLWNHSSWGWSLPGVSLSRKGTRSGQHRGWLRLTYPLAQTASALDTDHPVMQRKPAAAEVCPTDSPKSRAGLQCPAHSAGFHWHQQLRDKFASAVGLSYVIQWPISHSSHMCHSPATVQDAFKATL